MILIFLGQKVHSVAQAEWGATFQVGTEDLKKGDRGYHDTFKAPVLFSRGTTAP